MNAMYPRLRGLAGRRAGRVCALLLSVGALGACAIDGAAPPSSEQPPAPQAQPAAPTGSAPTPAPRSSAPAAKRPAPEAAPPRPRQAAPAQDAPRAKEATPPEPPALPPQAIAPPSSDEPLTPPLPKAAPPGTIPDVELTRELLYQILASEIAAQRGEYGRATATYLSIARETGDPRLARRATELALAGRLIESAVPAAELWHQLEPDSDMAAQTLETLLLSTGRFIPAEPLLAKRLAQARADGSLPIVYRKLQTLLTRVADKSAALDMLARLAEPDAREPTARLAVAAVAMAADKPDRALAEARAAMALEPDDPEPAMAAARYAHQGEDPEGARAILSGFLERNPDATDARFMLARLMLSDGDADGAREQFEHALASRPDDPMILFSLGQLAYQTGQPDVAADYLKRYVELPADVRRNNDPAYMFLGQLAEEQRRYEEAADWYARVDSGEQRVPALVRRAISLGKLGRVEEARTLLAEAAAGRSDDQVRLVLAESQVLRDAGRHEEAFELLGGALAERPDNPDLLYDQAMVAERLDRIDVLEKNLRRIIALQPDHAHAYNALGYTLADRNERLEEAHELIRKALELSPDDAHIEDSMGWVLFRLGKLEEAEQHLRRAYERSQEAEIAAHLGEVLWAQGRHDEARRLWQEARGREPDNETLRKTLARLQVRL